VANAQIHSLPVPILEIFHIPVHNDENPPVLESRNDDCKAEIMTVGRDQKQINNTSNSLIILHKCTK
jgi:hypothetical protein